MSVLEIITFPDELLTRSLQVVEDIDGKVQEFIDHMAQTMYHAPGIGLAANQVGKNCRILVYDLNPNGERSGEWEAFVNPVIIEQEGEIISEEGCLSVVEYRADVKRSARVCVKAFDRHGEPIEREYRDLLAVVMQHEIDHLNGLLFIDHISKLKRSMYIKRRMKQLKKDGDD